jgi:hypothetical protein
VTTSTLLVQPAMGPVCSNPAESGCVVLAATEDDGAAEEMRWCSWGCRGAESGADNVQPGVALCPNVSVAVAMMR